MNLGDTVYWEGNFFLNFKEGKNREDLKKSKSIEELHEISNFHFLSGENIITEIGDDIDGIDWGKTMYKLDNGKIFSEKDLKLINN